MKKILLALVCACALTRVGICAIPNSDREFAWLNCNSGVYMKGFGGLNVTHEPRWHHAKYRTGTGYVVGAALGYKWDFLSLEGEFSYRHNFIDRLTVDLDALNIHVSGDIEQYCGFGNLLLGYPISSCFAPYIGAGVGYRHFDPGVNFDNSPDRSLSRFIDSSDEWGVYQIIGGFNFAVSSCINMQLEYRYMDGWSNVKCGNHTVDLSATFLF